MAPASRPVVCGPSLTQAYDEVNDEAQMPPPVNEVDVWVICADSGDTVPSTVSRPTRDLGILGGALASGVPGGVEEPDLRRALRGQRDPGR